MSKITSAARKLNKLAKKQMALRDSKPKCVHRALLLRSLIIMKNIKPDTEKFFAPMMKLLMTYCKRPDVKGDYENGMGRHYYCATSVSGKKLPQYNSYFLSGMGKPYKSARAMFEEDYTMALTMYRAGYMAKCAEFLGRAVHMLSDMCCIPHTASMTYFSSGRRFHKAYELLAEAIYPDYIDEQDSPNLPNRLFADRQSFADDLNNIAAETAAGIADIAADPIKAVTDQLYRTERIIAIFLFRFIDDLTMPERKAHFITNGSGCRILRGTAPLTVKITKKGIQLHGVNPSPDSAINVTNTYFYAAHRHDGLYTLSPAKDDKGLVLDVGDGKIEWRKFDPERKEQLFKI